MRLNFRLNWLHTYGVADDRFLAVVLPVSNRLSGIVPPPLVCDTFWKDSVGRSRNGFVVSYPWLKLPETLFNPIFSNLKKSFLISELSKALLTHSNTWLLCNCGLAVGKEVCKLEKRQGKNISGNNLDLKELALKSDYRSQEEKRSFSHINKVLMETHFVLNIRREATAILSLDKLSHRVVCRLLFPKTNQFFLQDEQGGNIFLLLVLYYFMFLRNRSCSCIIDYARKIPFRLLLLHTPSRFFLVKPKLPL